MQLVAHTNEIGLEVVIDTETGASYASQSALAGLVGTADTTVMRFSSSAGLTPLKAIIPTKTGFKEAVLYNEDQIRQVLSYYNAGSKEVRKFYNLPPVTRKNSRKTVHYIEKEIQRTLLSLSNNSFKTEVKCEVGKIDLLTDTAIVEIKSVKELHHALGQVLAYSIAIDAPLEPIIICFGECTQEFLDKWFKICSVYNVTLIHVDLENPDSLEYAYERISSGEIWTVKEAICKLWELEHTY